MSAHNYDSRSPNILAKPAIMYYKVKSILPVRKIISYGFALLFAAASGLEMKHYLEDVMHRRSPTRKVETAHTLEHKVNWFKFVPAELGFSLSYKPCLNNCTNDFNSVNYSFGDRKGALSSSVPARKRK